MVADTRTGETVRVGTITPRRKADGSCVFLDGDDRCTIHAVAPAGCAMFDTHMGLVEAQRRGLALVVSQCGDEYQALRLRMKQS